MNAKLVVIDDDPTMINLLHTLLRLEGYEVVATEHDANLDSLLITIRTEKPELVLMDVHLRQTSGIEILEAIRGDAEIRSTGIIMASGMDLSERCLKNGADAFLMKPFMPDDLIQQIKRVLNDRN